MLVKCPNVVCITVLAAVLSIASAKAQGVTAQPSFGTDKYAELLNILFPTDVALSRNGYWMILRFRVYGQPESEIVIRQEGAGADATASVDVLKVAGRIDAFTQAEAHFTRNPSASVASIAKLINVDRRSFKVQVSAADGWRESLYEAIEGSMKQLRADGEVFRKDGTMEIVLHGTVYDLWYTQGAVKSHWRFLDFDRPNIEHAHLPLAKWMNSVLAAVEPTR